MTARLTASTPAHPGNSKDVVGVRLKPIPPHVIVLLGAAGDLCRRKLIPGLSRLFRAGLLPECRIVGTSLEALDHERLSCLRTLRVRRVLALCADGRGMVRLRRALAICAAVRGSVAVGCRSRGDGARTR